MAKNQYAIFDWAGNRHDTLGTFECFESAWDFILGDLTDRLSLIEEDYQDYYVERVSI
jgi:hypothetical protein